MKEYVSGMSSTQDLRVTLVGGPTTLLEIGGIRLLTDPTFDPAGTRYANGPVELAKTAEPALSRVASSTASRTSDTPYRTVVRYPLSPTVLVQAGRAPPRIERFAGLAGARASSSTLPATTSVLLPSLPRAEDGSGQRHPLQDAPVQGRQQQVFGDEGARYPAEPGAGVRAGPYVVEALHRGAVGGLAG